MKLQLVRVIKISEGRMLHFAYAFIIIILKRGASQILADFRMLYFPFITVLTSSDSWMYRIVYSPRAPQSIYKWQFSISLRVQSLRDMNTIKREANSPQWFGECLSSQECQLPRTIKTLPGHCQSGIFCLTSAVLRRTARWPMPAGQRAY